MRRFIDITGIVWAMSGLGRPLTESQRISLRTLDYQVGLLLHLSHAIRRLGEESSWRPLREFAQDEFILAYDPHAELTEVLYALKPPVLLWCGKPESDERGILSAAELDLVVEADAIKQAVSSANETVNQQFALIPPRTEQVKQASRLNLNGIVLKVEPHTDFDGLEEAASYAAKLGLELGLALELTGFSEPLLQRLDPELAIFGSAFIATVMGASLELLAQRLSELGT